jgi:hypothetical protein
MSTDLEKTKILGIITFLILAIQLSHSEQVITVQGHYAETNYNLAGKPSMIPVGVGSVADGGEENMAGFLNVSFVATLGKNTWRICATNQANEWETLTYDGTNTYLLTSFKGRVDPRPNTNFWAPKSGAISFGTVNAGNRYSAPGTSYVEMFFPWIVYGLPPRDVSSGMPLPWGNYDVSLRDYGWRWNVTPSADERFIEAFKVVRDTSLDLVYKDEFLRPTFRYPGTMQEFDMAQRTLEWRKASPNGNVEAVYTVNEWYKTNNLAVPASVEFEGYIIYAGSTNTFRWNDTVLKLDQISIDEDTIKVPALVGATYVRDFRYTRRSESRIFPFAAYTQSGAWKSGNDPELLAQRDDYLKHGPKYGDYGLPSDLLKLGQENRLVLAWALLALVQVVAIAMITIFILTKTKNKQTKQ